jgi:hypothetical protein
MGFSTLIAMAIGKRRIRWNEAIQARVSLTSAVLQQMKGIKLLGLTDYVQRKIQSKRVTELDQSKGYRWIVVWLNTNGMLLNRPGCHKY